MVPQILLIINGEGWVRGNEVTKFFVKAGDAVFWKNDWHETTIEKGLMAFVIESEELMPSSLILQDKKK